MTSALFGYLGDIIQRKSYKGRAILTSFFVFIMMPLYIAMFLTPMKNLELTSSSNPVEILFSLIRQIAFNPWMTTLFILAILSSAAQSANTPNWLALITDVNLPEHRGTAFSISNLANGIGRTIGNSGVGLALSLVSKYTKEPESYIITLILFQVFLIPSALCYIKMSRVNTQDIKEVKSVLKERALSLEHEKD